jgi:hypothetical protein
MSQSRFLDPASALFAAKRRPRSRNVSTAGSCRKCRCQEGALASWRRSETATPKLKGQAIGWARIGRLPTSGLSLGSFRSIACNYAGLRGEGSTPVPLPPPFRPKHCFLRTVSLANMPSIRGHFQFELWTADRYASSYCTPNCHSACNMTPIDSGLLTGPAHRRNQNRCNRCLSFARYFWMLLRTMSTPARTC